MELKRAEQVFMNNLATQSLRQQYRVKAHSIGSNAIGLVNDFFNSGIEDTVFNRPKIYWREWTLTDLDRALNEMQKQNLGKAEKFVMTFLENEFINSSGSLERALNNKEEWKGLKS